MSLEKHGHVAVNKKSARGMMTSAGHLACLTLVYIVTLTSAQTSFNYRSKPATSLTRYYGSYMPIFKRSLEYNNDVQELLDNSPEYLQKRKWFHSSRPIGGPKNRPGYGKRFSNDFLSKLQDTAADLGLIKYNNRDKRSVNFSLEELRDMLMKERRNILGAKLKKEGNTLEQKALKSSMLQNKLRKRFSSSRFTDPIDMNELRGDPWGSSFWKRSFSTSRFTDPIDMNEIRGSPWGSSFWKRSVRFPGLRTNGENYQPIGLALPKNNSFDKMKERDIVKYLRQALAKNKRDEEYSQDAFDLFEGPLELQTHFYG